MKRLRIVDDENCSNRSKIGLVTKSNSLTVYAQKYHPKYCVIMSAHKLYIDQQNKIHHYLLYLASQFPL